MSNDKIIEKDLSILAKSSIFVFIGFFLSKVFMYLYRITIARYYGPEIYGLFSLAFMVVGFFVAFASFGLYDGILRFIPIYRGKKEPEKIKYLVKLTNRFLFFSSILGGSILYFSSSFIATNFFHDLQLIFYLKIFSILVPLQIFINIYFGIIRSHEKIKAYAFGMNILQNAMKFLLVILFIYLGILSSKAVSLSYLLGIFSALIFAYFYCRLKLPIIFMRPKLNKKEKLGLRKKLFSYSWPLILYTMIGTLMYSLDTFLIGYFKTSYWVGIYNAAIPLAMLLVLSSEMFMQMFFPLITRERASKNKTIVRELSKQITKWIYIINLPLTILMLLFSGVFINLFFGSEYLPAINALRMLVLAQFVYSLAIVSSSLLLSYGKSKTILYNLIFTSAINFILNWVLIPKYGINGAAFATLISSIILFILVVVENYYFNKIFAFRRKMIIIFFISLVPTSILFWASILIQVNFIWLMFFGLLFVTIYLGLIILTRSFDKNDILVIKSIFSKDKW